MYYALINKFGIYLCANAKLPSWSCNCNPTLLHDANVNSAETHCAP